MISPFYWTKSAPKFVFSNLILFFRADILLHFKQLLFLVKRSSTLFFLNVLPFHYSNFFLCSVFLFFYLAEW